MTDKRIRDVLRTGTSRDVIVAMREAGDRLNALAAHSRSTHPRSTLSVALQNLAARMGHELLRLAQYFDAGVDIVAWSTRNVFELHLLIRYALISTENAGAFLAEAAMDEQQVLEGFLSLSDSKDEKARRTVEDRIAQIFQLAQKHGISLKKPVPTGQLAKIVGCEADYLALFKFMSKYVHPSSWLVNKPPAETQNETYRNILAIHAQLYAGDSYERVREALGVVSDG